jgi:tetratricopeptide (TPR) repeat protein
MPATLRGKFYLAGLLFTGLLLLVPAAPALLVIAPGDTSPANTAAAWNDLGNSFASQKRYDMAIDAYNRAIALEPNFARAYFSRGVALAALGRHEQALESYDRALELDPSLSAVMESYREVSENVVYPPIPSGSLVKGSWQSGWNYLAIDNRAGAHDVVVALAPRGSTGASFAVYVAKGYSHRFDQVLPPGYYDVYIAFGERWDNQRKEFARDAGYLRWELPQTFGGLQGRGYTMTFVTQGPMPSWWSYTLTPIGRAQFPAL